MKGREFVDYLASWGDWMEDSAMDLLIFLAVICIALTRARATPQKDTDPVPRLAPRQASFLARLKYRLGLLLQVCMLFLGVGPFLLLLVRKRDEFVQILL